MVKVYVIKSANWLTSKVSWHPCLVSLSTSYQKLGSNSSFTMDCKGFGKDEGYLNAA